MPVLRAPRVPAAGAAAKAARQRRTWLIALAAGSPLLAVFGLVVLILTLLAGDLQQRQECAGGLPAPSDAPGSLGGVAGTGLSRAQIRAVRAGSPHAGPSLTEGAYDTTSYGPPWGGINGPGATTSGGVRLGGGAPRIYMLAVDPLLIGHGQLVYAWPNPFGWRGPFLAADTGSAIQGHRIDFYDWRGRSTQFGWGHRTVQVSHRPIAPGATDAAGAANCAVAGSAVGERIGQIARRYLGQDMRIQPLIGLPQPGPFPDAWCAQFATNVWRKAGVPIPVNAFSGYPYTWAQSRGQLFKAVGRPPRRVTPPVGAALMFGTGPQNTDTSEHINLVDRVLPDGTFMVTGGNQDSSRVTRYGPCRLSRTDPARLTGPGCDSRPIYGIAKPSGPGSAS